MTSEWGTPDMFEGGLEPELLLGSKYGRRLHFWDLHRRQHLQEIDFGPDYQLASSCARPTTPQGLRLRQLVSASRTWRSSIWVWHRDGRMGGRR